MELESTSLTYQAKQSGDFRVDVEERLKKKDSSSDGRVRCPKCQWTPRSSDRWMCHCRHTWNTFDTRGLCPGCNYQWTQTMCLSCLQWSEHQAWYETEKPDSQ